LTNLVINEITKKRDVLVDPLVNPDDLFSMGAEGPKNKEVVYNIFL
jgi:hypothetical protein